MKAELPKSKEILQKLCIYAFDVIRYKLKLCKEPKFPQEFSGMEFPLFVTWKIGKDKDLRGCIGTFASSSLEENLTEYALYAAFGDQRFDPITKEEIPELHCGISLLNNFQKCDDIYGWQIGKHGIQIEFTHKGHKYRGTYLPEVALEQKWDQKAAIKSLLKKAQFYGDLSDVKDSIKLTTYESTKIHLAYGEYIKIKGE